MEEDEHDVAVKVDSNLSTGMVGSVVVLCLFVTGWLTGGDPDLLDALIESLMCK